MKLWHFINKKNEKYGYSGPWIVVQTKPLDGLLVIVLLKQVKKLYKKIETFRCSILRRQLSSIQTDFSNKQTRDRQEPHYSHRSNNFNIRHFLARITRRTKVVSKIYRNSGLDVKTMLGYK